jgi:predicted anti-sigma-YlaC factor YlaD
MNKQKPKCKDVMQHICESLGEDLDSDRCVAIKHHIDNCTDCKTYFKTVEITIDYYKKYNVSMPQDAHSRLMNFLQLTDCE